MADKKLVEAITSMEEDFAQWYTDVVKKAELVDWLLTQKEVSQDTLLKHLANKQTKGLTWNYVEDKKYPAAPVTALLTNIISEAGGTPSNEKLVRSVRTLNEIATIKRWALPVYYWRNQLLWKRLNKTVHSVPVKIRTSPRKYLHRFFSFPKSVPGILPQQLLSFLPE